MICYRSDDRMQRMEDLYYKLEYIEDVKILSSERDCIDLPVTGNWFELTADETSVEILPFTRISIVRGMYSPIISMRCFMHSL